MKNFLLHLLFFQLFTTSCIFSDQKNVTTTEFMVCTTNEPGWTWTGGKWHCSENTIDTVPPSYCETINTEIKQKLVLITLSKNWISEKNVSISYETTQPGWIWNSGIKKWSYSGNTVDALPEEYAVVLKSDRVLSDYKTKKTIERVSEEQKIYYRLIGGDWQWDEQKNKWLLKGVVTIPEYDKTGKEIYKQKIETHS